MSASNALEIEFLKLVLGKTASFTYPLTPYIALFTTKPGEDGAGGTEVSTSGTAYARQAITAKFGTPATNVVANTADVDFGTATANWGTLTGSGLYTAVTGGTLLVIGDLPNVSVVNGQPVKFPVGALTFTIE